MRIFASLLIVVAMGCATPLPEEKTSYNAKLHVEDVMMNCDKMHLLFGTNASPVDCRYSFPRDLTLSLPSIAFHNEHIDVVLQFQNNWCSSVEAHTGTDPFFTRIFREEQYSESVMCGPGL